MESFGRVWDGWASLPVAFGWKRHFAAGQKARTLYLVPDQEAKRNFARWSLSTHQLKPAPRASRQTIKHKIYYRPNLKAGPAMFLVI